MKKKTNLRSGRPPRVLVIGRFTSIHTIRFVEELKRQGLDVCAIDTGHTAIDVGVPTIHTRHNMRVFGIPKTGTLGYVLLLARAIWLFSPDIIHIQDEVQMCTWLNYLPYLDEVLVYTNWGHNPEIQNRRDFQRSLARVHLVTSDAPDVLDEIGAFAKKARRLIVRFGADTETFRPGAPSQETLGKYGLSGSVSYIISPRSIRPIYNQITLVRAAARVLEAFPDLRIILKHHHNANYSDSDPYWERIRAEATRLGIWKSFLRIDHVIYEEQRDLYRLARAAVSIPLEDGFPATIFEAMACGCPLVVSNDASYDGVVVDGENAQSIEPTDEKGLAECLIRYLKDDAFTKNIRENGFKTVKQKGDFATEIGRLIGGYEELLAEERRR